MWNPEGYTYNELSIFRPKISVDLRDALRAYAPAIEAERGLYAALCILDTGLNPLPFGALPLDGDEGELLAHSVVECFGREAIFALARTGRAVLLVVRTDDLSRPEDEQEFDQWVATSAITLQYSIEDNLGYTVSIAVGPAFDCFEDCEQVACEALTAADFVRFVEMPTEVVTPQYCSSVKEIFVKRNPDYRIPNYERPILSAVLNDNLDHAERIVNDLLTAHMVDPLHTFPAMRSNMLGIMRMCQSLCCLEPLSLANENPRLPEIQNEMSQCPTAQVMRELIREYFEILETYLHRHKEEEARTERMNRILTYIEKNMADPGLGAPMVCDEFGMSTAYFSRIFKDAMGVNFSVYLQTLRITKAKKLLLESDLNLAAIAQEVGYIGSQNLFRLFKRYEGMSPSAYRQMAGGMGAAGEDEE